MTALEILAVLGVAASLAVIVVRVCQLADTLTIEVPPAPPDDPPETDPMIKPSDPFDALLVDLELFRLTNMAPGSKEVRAIVTVVPDAAGAATP